MITGELKSQVDKVWEALWTGGVSNPIAVIEQFTYLFFIRRLDEIQLVEEKKAAMIGEPIKRCFIHWPRSLGILNYKI